MPAPAPNWLPWVSAVFHRIGYKPSTEPFSRPGLSADVHLRAHEKFGRAGLACIVGDKTWDAMCSYAHGDTRPLLRRVNADAITPVYKDEEKTELLQGADFLSIGRHNHPALNNVRVGCMPNYSRKRIAAG